MAILALAVSVGLAGCESFQRKFTRKPKGPRTRSSPIFQFQDYSQVTTPLERYRKHYLMFDYWGGELTRELSQSNANFKRLLATSASSLEALRTMQGLLVEEMAQQLVPIIEAREAVHQRLQGRLDSARATLLKRKLDVQKREIDRTFYWRRVEGQLKPNRTRTPAPAGDAERVTPSDAPTPTTTPVTRAPEQADASTSLKIPAGGGM